MARTYEGHIEEDIDQIKSLFGVDISGTIGRVLYSFVSYWKSPAKKDAGKIIPVELYRVIRGLEEYLIRVKVVRGLRLENTLQSGGEISKILRERKEEKIAELEQYLLEMTVREPKERAIELSLDVPE